MKRYLIWIMIVLGVSWLASACQSNGMPGSEARTYYESLDLATPEDAVQTFASAFQRQDFMTVYLVLDAEAQRQLRMENARTFSWGHLIGAEANTGLADDLSLRELADTQVDAWYFFDQIMRYAAEVDDLLIDLRGDTQVLRSEAVQMPDGRQAMDVIAEMEGLSGEVTFRTVQDRDSRWRVYLVSAPAASGDSWPAPGLQGSS